MWWIIIAVIFIAFTACILKDTHVKKYNRTRYNYYTLDEEYDLKLPLWAWMIIAGLYFAPIINIVAFIAFLIYYIYHAVLNPERGFGYEGIYTFSLNGNNWVTKGLLAIKKVLNKKI